MDSGSVLLRVTGIFCNVGNATLAHTVLFNNGLPFHASDQTFCGRRLVNTPSVEPVLKSRLLPRISFRFMFLLTLGFALLGAATRSAVEGYAFAIAVLAFIGCLVIFFVACMFVFVLTWAMSLPLRRSRENPTQGSPFADGQLPPQILPPRNPMS